MTSVSKFGTSCVGWEGKTQQTCWRVEEGGTLHALTTLLFVQ